MISGQVWQEFLRYLIERHGRIRPVISEEMEKALAEYLASHSKKRASEVLAHKRIREETTEKTRTPEEARSSPPGRFPGSWVKGREGELT